MNGNMVLIMVDECGDEYVIGRFTLHLDLDDDELLIWQARKIEAAAEQYPEARDFYFEDRRSWNRQIAIMLRENW